MCNRSLKLAGIDSDLKGFEIARKADMHPAPFSAIVNEHYRPTEDQKNKIAKALKKTVAELFSEGVAV